MRTISIENIFRKKIPKVWQDYEPRDSQIEMSRVIWDSIQNGKHVLLEAGTGVGKSLAYLIPAALYSINQQKTVIVTTETKTLQDQLLQNDILILEKILDQKIDAKVAMGAGNYLCIRKFKQMEESGNIPVDLLNQWEQFLQWTSQTTFGNRIEYKGILSADTWSKLGREVDNCLGKFCPNYSDSFYFKARDSWKHANILITNHALVGFHLANGNGVLPEFDVMIIDEAHSFPDIVGRSMRLSLHYESVLRIFSFLYTKDKPCLLTKIANSDKLEKCLKDSLEKLDQFFGKIQEEVFHIHGKERIAKPLKLDGGALESSLELLIEELLQNSSRYSKEASDPEEKETAIQLEMSVARLKSVSELAAELRTRTSPNLVFWSEPPPSHTKDRFATIYCEPLNVRDYIVEKLSSVVKTVVYTSATLSANGNDFQYFKDQLGYNPGYEKIFPSPFQYEKQAVLFIPSQIPDPSLYEESYHESITEYIEKLIRLTHGNCFVLFTSIRSMNWVKKNLESSLPYPIHSQGDLGAMSAREKFLSTPDSVLFGVNSFWQGIDIKGEKLQNVIITKLPFQVPTDPVLVSRIEIIKESGKNPFLDYQLPQACILLKQGFGRLIRSTQDIGIVSILDPRIHTKSYGKEFLKIFPKGIKIATNFKDLEAYFENLPKIHA